MPFVPVEEAPRGRFVPVDEPGSGAGLIPGAAPDTQAPAGDPRQVGFMESAGRTAGAAAIPVARTGGLALGALAGILSPKLREKVFRKMDELVGGMRGMYEQKPDEEFSTAGRLAGGIASSPIEMAGGMGLQHGVERAAQVVERGGTLGQAAKAGAVSGGVHVALNALPVKVGGAVGSVLKGKLGTVAAGGLTGGAIAGASGAASRRAENAALPEGEQFADLKQGEAVSAEEVGLGAAMGALPGAASATKNPKARDRILKPVAAAAGKALDVNPQKLALAKDAIDLDFDVMPHQISDRGPLMEVAGEAFEQVPFSKSVVKKNERRLTRRLIEQVNPDDPSKQLTPGVMRRAQDTSGRTIGQNMSEISVPLDALEPHLATIREGLSPATDSTDAAVHRYLGQISKLAGENGGAVPGKALRELDTEIGAEMRRLGHDRSDVRARLDDLQDAIRDTSEAQMTPEKAKQTQEARVRYAKIMSLVPLAGKISRTGYIKPKDFAELVEKTKYGKYLTATDRGGEWGKLANAARVIEPGEMRGRLWAGGTTAVSLGGVAFNPGTAPAAATAAGVALAGANAYNRNGPALVRRLVRDADAKQAKLKALSTDMPPDAPPPEPSVTPGAGGPQDNSPGPGGSKVLPAPEADLMPSAELESPAPRAAVDGVQPEGLLPAVGDDQPPSRIIRGAGEARRVEPSVRATDPEDPGALPQEEPPRKNRNAAPAGPERPYRAMLRDRGVYEPQMELAEGSRRERPAEQIPAVPGRPDMPEVMVAGDLGDAAKQGRAPREVGRDAPTGTAMQSDNAALARQGELQRRYGSAGGKMEPSVDQIPVGEATEIKPERVTPAGSPPDAIDPRLARVDELRSRTDSKAVHAALDKRAADVKKQIKAETAAAKREADVAELEDAASKTDDVEMRQHLLAEANKLRAEKPPAGEVKEGQPPLPVEKPGKIPVGQAKEVDAPLPEPEAPEPLPVGEATELQPEVVEPAPAANEPPTQALVPEATTVENAAPETKKVKRMIEPKTEASVKRVPGGPGEQGHVEVTLPDGGVRRIQRMNSAETQGLPGWHDMDATGEHASYLGDTQQAAIRALTKKKPTQALVPEATTVENAAPETKKVKRTIEPKTETFEELSARMKATPAAERSAEDMGRYWDMHRERGQAEETKAAAERGATREVNRGKTLAERKADAVLDKSKRVFDGELMTLREKLDKELAAGAVVGQREGGRALILPSGAHLTEKQIGKTAIDYAVRKSAEKKPTQALVPEATPSENVAPETKKVKRMIEPKTEAPLTKEQRQAAVNAETMEDRPNAPEVAQPTKGKRVRVETVTLSGPKTVTASLYEIPGYKGPQLAVAEYKTSLGQGYRVYLPKSGVFIHDNNGVQSLADALHQAVHRVGRAREVLAKKKPIADAPTEPPKRMIEPKTEPTSAADWANEMARLRKEKPRSVKQVFGAKGPTPEQAAAHAQREREWNAKYRRASANQKEALSRDNAAHAENKRREAAGPNALSYSMGGSDMTFDLGEPAWKVTPREVEAKVRAEKRQGHKDSTLNMLKGEHRVAVERAIGEGKPVPAETLYDYPSMLRKDLTDKQADLAVDHMVDTFRATKSYDKAVEAYRAWKPKD